MSHELIGNSVAELEFANRNRTVKSEVQLNTTTAAKKVSFPAKYSILLDGQIFLQ